MNTEPLDETAQEGVSISNEEILQLYEKKTKEILFAFTDEMLAIKEMIRKEKEKIV